MCCTRTFYNVGHGLFAVERIGKKTIVYDCGSRAYKTRLEPKIKKIFKTDDEIEFVFISHYDLDHINGLKELLTRCKVKKLVLPMLPRKDKLYTILTHHLSMKISKGDDVFVNFVIDPISFCKELSPTTEIVFVKETDMKDLPESKHPTSCIESGKQLFLRSYSKCTAIYVPYNIRLLSVSDRNKFVADIYSAISSHTKTQIARLRNMPLIDIFQKYNLCAKHTSVKSIITKYIPKGFTINSTSLTLYSEWSCCKDKSCLYTGDYDANQNYTQLHNAYLKFWNNIYIIQVPHHGSDKNHNTKIYTSSIIAIIPARLNCKNPDYTNVSTYLSANCLTCRITGNGDVSINNFGHIV